MASMCFTPRLQQQRQLSYTKMSSVSVTQKCPLLPDVVPNVQNRALKKQVGFESQIWPWFYKQ